jgi:hydroxymethylpyrimidine/phosphomethylpyrimidine kinase
VKTGMLFKADTISAVASRLRAMPENVVIVVDPVMVATSGAALMRPEAVRKFRTQLIPECDWLTPNIPEAEIITGIKISSFADMARCAQFIGEKFCCSCIVKGGHSLSCGKKATDMVFHRGEIYELSSDIIDVESSHGTGCAFSSALTAGFAVRKDWKDAVVMAKKFVFSALKNMTSLAPGLDVLNSSVLPQGQVSLAKVELP